LPVFLSLGQSKQSETQQSHDSNLRFSLSSQQQLFQDNRKNTVAKSMIEKATTIPRIPLELNDALEVIWQQALATAANLYQERHILLDTKESLLGVKEQ
jgi:hypothetical protein